MARLDPHSYNDTEQPMTEWLDWRATVDFDTRTLQGQAVLHFREPGEGPLDLDTRDLDIQSVTTGDRDLKFQVHPAEPILGSRLAVDLPAGTAAVTIRYRTSPTASALQWLSPAQTFGGRQPFLFSQCQAIHARSVVPLQDTPRIRIRFEAELTVPQNLKALMAAAFESRDERDGVAVERYRMPQSIPPYLLALAVGDLGYRDVGPRSRVWAEPAIVEKAAWEFASVDAMLEASEKLFGPYDWERFDILTMPQSFPYGGMENPRLTFLTPTLLAGDRSLVNVVAHELAHSWTGNLVSNASADHFWLNEGFTVFAERRIHEVLEGADVTALHAAIGWNGLQQSLQQHADHPEHTHLRTHLSGFDPDDVYSLVPYEKGYLFLRALEEAVGRAAFDAFLRQYLSTFRFQSITTEDFVAFTERVLPGALARVEADSWLHGPGVPSNAPRVRSARLEALRELDGRLPSDEGVRNWSPAEWQLYLENLSRPSDRCAVLDQRFQLSRSQNYEVLVAWLTLAAESRYAPSYPRIEEVLSQVGRMKYLKPLYQALLKDPETRPLAEKCFAAYRERYHPIAQQVIGGLLVKATMS